MRRSFALQCFDAPTDVRNKCGGCIGARTTVVTSLDLGWSLGSPRCATSRTSSGSKMLGFSSGLLVPMIWTACWVFAKKRRRSKTKQLSRNLSGRLVRSPWAGRMMHDVVIIGAAAQWPCLRRLLGYGGLDLLKEPNVVFGQAVRSRALPQQGKVPERWLVVVFIALGNVGHGL